MNNERGEIVTGAALLLMAGMMIFGMFFMHGHHGGVHEHGSAGHGQDHSVQGHQQMHQAHGDAEQSTEPAAVETK